MSMAATAKQSNDKTSDQTSNDQQGLESSKDFKDSSESSNSQSESESGDESGDSTGSSSGEDDQHGESGDEQPEGNDGEVSGSDKSNESYKSLNTSVVKSIVTPEVTADPSTVAKSTIKGSVKSVMTKSPVVVALKTPEVPRAVASIDDLKQESPVPITPAKSLGPVSPPHEQVIDFKDIGRLSQPAPAATVPKQESSLDEESERENDKTRAVSVSKASDSDTQRKRGRHSSKSAKKELLSPSSKRSKKDKSDKAIKVLERQSKSVERVQEQVKQLQAQLDEVRKSESWATKRKKDRKHKASKTKKTKTTSSDAESSRSSMSEGPTTSSRIAKIPMSRKLQGLAMERAKQVGSIRKSETASVEVLNALKLVKTAVFPVEPTQSYRDFNFVPGTGLPHILKHLGELQDDLNAFLGVSVRLNLELAHELDTAKKQRVNSMPSNEFALIWQFGNDLARAAASSSKPTVAPVPKPAEGAVVNKVAGDEVVKDTKVLKKDDAKGVDQGKDGVVTKSRVDKKKKSSSSKVEEQG